MRVFSMNFRFGRGRPMPSPAKNQFDDVPPRAGMPAGDVPYVGSLANGSLVDRYADRLVRSEHLAPLSDGPIAQEIVRAEPIGRGTMEHAVATGQAAPGAAGPFTRHEPRGRRGRRNSEVRDTLRERLIAATLALTLFLTGFAGTASAQQRYLVQPEDTLESVAAEFGVEPEAILRASLVANPPLTDFGIYPKLLVPVLNDNEIAADAIYTDGNPTPLKTHLDAGDIVLTWLAFWGDTGRTFDDDGQYTVIAGMHVMAAYGYDDHGVAFSDPGAGTYRFLEWETFLGMWELIGGMALAVYPV
jgi:LysM repeat protein